MHLLYLDESGNENDAKDAYFVLAGISLFERQTYFLSKALDEIQEQHFPGRQPIQFHATDIRNAHGFWRNVPPPTRRQVLSDITTAVLNSPAKGRTLYAAAIEKTGMLWGEPAVEKATEEICRRFDIRLMRLYQEQNDRQRGLLIFSEGRLDARAKIWVRGFHQRGTSWGAINNLADIPYFASPRESRLLQVADFVAHATWLLYEKRDPSLIKDLIRAFDSDGDVLHGLVHVRATPHIVCDCPACASRRNPGTLGSWV